MNKPIHPRQPSQRNAKNTKQDAALAGWLGTSQKVSKGISKTKQKGRSTTTVAAEKNLLAWLGPTQKSHTERENKEIKVVRLEELEARAEAEERAQDEQKHRNEIQKKTGLEDVVASIRGERSQAILDKSKKTWSEFKGSDADVRDELDAYKKDKNRYTDRVAFLDRADRREWENDMARKRKR